MSGWSQTVKKCCLKIVLGPKGKDLGAVENVRTPFPAAHHGQASSVRLLYCPLLCCHLVRQQWIALLRLLGWQFLQYSFFLCQTFRCNSDAILPKREVQKHNLLILSFSERGSIPPVMRLRHSILFELMHENSSSVTIIFSTDPKSKWCRTTLGIRSSLH